MNLGPAIFIAGQSRRRDEQANTGLRPRGRSFAHLDMALHKSSKGPIGRLSGNFNRGWLLRLAISIDAAKDLQIDLNKLF
jgi:hypothetical protein